MAVHSTDTMSRNFRVQYTPRMTHSRSASWSYTTGDGQINLSSHLDPIRSVIREFVPSFGTSGSGFTPVGTQGHQNNDTVYVDLPENTTNETRRVFSRHHSSDNISINESDLNNDNTNNQQNGNGRPNGDRMEFQGFIKCIETSVPFLILLLSRIMWDHRLGILVGIGLTGTFFHANNTIKRQVSLKDKRLLRTSLWTILFLCGNVFFIYYVFYNQQLHRCLTFQQPNISHFDIWIVLWCVGITDYVIRMETMALKSLVIMVHRRMLPFKTRGKYYLMLEKLSQLYRDLTPIPLWALYFTNYTMGGEYFAIFSTGLYLILKIRILHKKLIELYRALDTFQHDVQYGTAATKDQIIGQGNTCPICQEEFSRAISLQSCKHTFCEDCISLWFDREQTCPMCRAKVVGDPSWRDGTTSAFIQLF